jgi:hypothetical protein
MENRRDKASALGDFPGHGSGWGTQVKYSGLSELRVQDRAVDESPEYLQKGPLKYSAEH